MTPLLSLPITLALIYRSYSHSSLTVPGILLATLTALIHASHPSPIPFTLLVTFFLLGTSATKVKKDVKATLTLSSTGHRTFGSSSRVEDWFGNGWNKHKPKVVSSGKNGGESKGQEVVKATGGQEPRSAIQVLANSVWASLLCLVHVYLYGSPWTSSFPSNTSPPTCFGKTSSSTQSTLLQDILLVGIISNYAAVTADTLSSELGILSATSPRHILTFRTVPPGTNGGITGAGLFAGLAGALIIGLTSVLLLPDVRNWDHCSIVAGDAENAEPGERAAELFAIVLAVGSWGALGSVLDSILGALFQASVVDRRSGKVVEAANGGRVLITSSSSGSASSSSSSIPGGATSTLKERNMTGTGTRTSTKGGKNEKTEENQQLGSRILGSGRDILDNNQVNLLMAGTMTFGGMGLVARAWEVELLGLLKM